MNEIRRNLYEIENEKNLFAPEIKEIERNLTELEEIFLKQNSIMIMMIPNIKK